MPSALELAAANALEAACEADVGVIARIELAEGADMITPSLRAKQVLYRFRKELGDPRYMALMIKLSPDDPDNELWLLRKAPPVHTSPGGPEASATVLDVGDL